MFRCISTAIVFSIATAQAISAQEATQSEEALAWDAVKSSGASAEVSDFIARYPAGEYTKEAKALLIDLLWEELDGEAPAAVVEQVEEPAEQVVAVTFSAPLTQGAPEIVGKSLEELIEGTPLFPPVEGLPESFWKEQECSNCHEWEAANLCTQANSYLSEAGSVNLEKQHPYGGTFKVSLRNWAAGGCE